MMTAAPPGRRPRTALPRTRRPALRPVPRRIARLMFSRRHVARLRIGDDRAEPRVHVGVAAAGAGRHGQFLDEAREDLAALGVGGALLVLDRVPLGMAGHVKTPEKSTKWTENLTLFFARMIQNHPDVGARPRARRGNRRAPLRPETRRVRAAGHLPAPKGAERQRRTRARASSAAAALNVALLEGRQAPRADPGAPIRPASGARRRRVPAQLDAVRVLAPFRDVGHEIDAERAARREHARDRRRASRRDRDRAAATGGCRTAPAPSGTRVARTAAARMSPRTNRSDRGVVWPALWSRARAGRASRFGVARARASVPTDRCRRDRRRRGPAAARRGRCRSRARAPGRRRRRATRRQNGTSRRPSVCAFSQS